MINQAKFEVLACLEETNTWAKDGTSADGRIVLYLPTRSELRKLPKNQLQKGHLYDVARGSTFHLKKPRIRKDMLQTAIAGTWGIPRISLLKYVLASQNRLFRHSNDLRVRTN